MFSGGIVNSATVGGLAQVREKAQKWRGGGFKSVRTLCG